MQQSIGILGTALKKKTITTEKLGVLAVSSKKINEGLVENTLKEVDYEKMRKIQFLSDSLAQHSIGLAPKEKVKWSSESEERKTITFYS